MDSNYFKEIRNYSTRTMEDKECARIILNILQREYDYNYRQLVNAVKDLAAEKAKDECRIYAEMETDLVGFGPTPRDFSHLNNTIEVYEKNLRSIKELILFVQERLTYEVPKDKTSS